MGTVKAVRGGQMSLFDRWLARWQVASRSLPGVRRVVAQDGAGEFGCSCPQWVYYRRPCWHIEQVKAALGKGPA